MNKRILVLVVLFVTVIFSGCSGDNDIDSANTTTTEALTSNNTTSEVLSSNVTTSEILSSNVTTSKAVSSKNKTFLKNSSHINSTYSDTSSLPKVYIPKTKEESVFLHPSLIDEGYDYIERWPAEKVVDMSRTEFVELIETLYEIDLPDSTVFEPKGTVEFEYKVLDKYHYDNMNFGVTIKQLMTHYTKSEINVIIEQLEKQEKLRVDLSEGRESFLSKKKQEIKKIVGDFSSKEHYLYGLFSGYVMGTNIPQRRYVFIMKEDNSDMYTVIFDGSTSNYELKNGILEVQPDGSAKVKK